MRAGWSITGRMVTRGTQPGVQNNFFFFLHSLTELRLWCLDPSCDAPSGQKNEFSSVAEEQGASKCSGASCSCSWLRLQTLCTAATLLQMKKAGSSFAAQYLSNCFLKSKPPTQRRDSGETRRGSDSTSTFSVVLVPPPGPHAAS